MKTFPSRYCRLFLLMLGTLPISCKKSSDPAPAAQTGCQITSFRTESGSTSSTSFWEYTPNGQLTTARQSAYRTDYTYNADGFLTALLTTANGVVVVSGTYDYAAGQLVTSTDKTATGTVLSTSAYTYDGAGALTRQTVAYPKASTYTYLYAGGKQTGYVVRSSSGAESQPYTFADGQVKRYLSGTYQADFEYDTLGRCTRLDERSQGKTVSYQVFEYTDGQSYNEAYRGPKGLPEATRRGHNLMGNNTGLPTKITRFTVPASGAAYKSAEDTYTHTKNGSGFPLETTWTRREVNAQGTVIATSVTRYVYTYAGCSS